MSTTADKILASWIQAGYEVIGYSDHVEGPYFSRDIQWGGLWYYINIESPLARRVLEQSLADGRHYAAGPATDLDKLRTAEGVG